MLISKIKHFKVEEISCPCCGLNNIHPMSIKKLDLIRDVLNRSMFINSACRCEKHNKKVGGVEDSSHKCSVDDFSFAFDVRANSSFEKFELVQYALRFGFHRIGIYKNFVHIDDNPSRKSAIWIG